MRVPGALLYYASIETVVWGPRPWERTRRPPHAAPILLAQKQRHLRLGGFKMAARSQTGHA